MVITMDLVNALLKNMTSESSIDALKGKTGGSSKQVESAVKAAIPSLIGSMTKNASSDEGAKSLLGALGQHKNTDSISSQIKNADELDGSKIIAKIMGGGKDDFIKEISKSSGLDITQSKSVLSSIAPAILSSLSAATSSEKKDAKEEKIDTSSIGSFVKSLVMDEDDQKAAKNLKGASSSSLLDILKKTVL